MAERRCMNCMKLLQEETEKCPYCGFERKYYQQEIYQLPVGHELQGGRYQIGRVIGEGGFGITYIGWDSKFSQVVAVKEYFVRGLATRYNTVSFNVTPYKQSDEEKYNREIQRVKKEATTIKQFANCQAIVRVEDYFEENNTVYIVMEYVEGITLKRYIEERGSGLPAEECLRLFQPLIKALYEIHRQGMLHRDISLDNIMFQQNGTLKLLDFGSAKEIGRETTSVTVRYGYAPPEQYDGEHQGTWTDVYALCVCLCNCLTGGQMEDSKLRKDGTGILGQTVFGLTRGQKAAIEKGIKLDYQERLQTMGELYKGLYEGLPDPGPVPDPKPVPDLGPVKVKYAAAAGAALVIFVLVVFAAFKITGLVTGSQTEDASDEGAGNIDGAVGLLGEGEEETWEEETWEEDGAVYTGVKADGKIEGEGQADYGDGSRYKGEFHAGLREGTGIMDYEDGSRYDGEWLAGKKEGKGILLYRDGSQYDGEWEGDRPNGSGTWSYKDGTSESGIWEDGRLQK